MEGDEEKILDEVAAEITRSQLDESFRAMVKTKRGTTAVFFERHLDDDGSESDL